MLEKFRLIGDGVEEAFGGDGVSGFLVVGCWCCWNYGILGNGTTIFANGDSFDVCYCLLPIERGREQERNLRVRVFSSRS